MNRSNRRLVTQAGVVIGPTLISAAFVELDSAFRLRTSSFALLAVYLPSCLVALVVLCRALKEPWWVKFAAAICYVALSSFITFLVIMSVVYFNTGN